jgi:hypothetical protein
MLENAFQSLINSTEILAVMDNLIDNINKPTSIKTQAYA